MSSRLSLGIIIIRSVGRCRCHQIDRSLFSRRRYRRRNLLRSAGLSCHFGQRNESDISDQPTSFDKSSSFVPMIYLLIYLVRPHRQVIPSEKLSGPIHKKANPLVSDFLEPRFKCNDPRRVKLRRRKLLGRAAHQLFKQ